MEVILKLHIFKRFAVEFTGKRGKKVIDTSENHHVGFLPPLVDILDHYTNALTTPLQDELHKFTKKEHLYNL